VGRLGETSPGDHHNRYDRAILLARRPSSLVARRLFIGLGVALLIGLATAGGTARGAAAVPGAVPPGTPNLALIALGPADLPGGRVLKQRYFADPDLVAGYDREFRSGASIGHSRALSLGNELDVLENDADAHGLYVTVKSIFGSSGGRALLAKSIKDQFRKDVKAKGTTKVTYGKIRALGVGNETFVQPITVTVVSVIRFSFVISVTRQARILSWLTVIGQPGGKVATEDIARLQRVVAGRILTALEPTNTALPTITGTATQGQTLTGSDGTWTNTPPGFTRSWLRCDVAGANCVAIAGATATTYTVAATDVGATLRYSVTATSSSGSSSPAVSAQTPIVAPLPPPPVS
jgi:hypothetical protein